MRWNPSLPWTTFGFIRTHIRDRPAMCGLEASLMTTRGCRDDSSGRDDSKNVDKFIGKKIWDGSNRFTYISAVTRVLVLGYFKVTLGECVLSRQWDPQLELTLANIS